MGARKRRLRLDDQLCFALYAATNAVVRAYRPLLGELGLTYPQYLVMLALWQDGAAPAHTLAARLQLGASAITPLVDRLEAAGLVTRARGTDRRVVLVALTEAGRRLEEKVAVAQQAVVCRTGLEEDSLAALRQELKALADRIAGSGSVPQDETV
ncbi:MarR family winged helix-turn-helix transcriptional regulator [Methylorubrum salsuginis]|uniref:DNA-binding transcriptional regulator, MarR family n=1 Tax=Methylorubrum salsuginis TaxID=414703 RepID=A0A1I4IWT2_9HYPH|nr:MarR family transcriptional regulator [Methylorubrum salsuginis]SFL58216.1 DNA-binding transcriptional regulator, MarR family [Methylorubrum salsuginis]